MELSNFPLSERKIYIHWTTSRELNLDIVGYRPKTQKFEMFSTLLSNELFWPQSLSDTHLWSTKGTSSRTFSVTLHVQVGHTLWDPLSLFKRMRKWGYGCNVIIVMISSTALSFAFAGATSSEKNMSAGGLRGLSTNTKGWSKTETFVFLLGIDVPVHYVLDVALRCLYYCTYSYEELFYTPEQSKEERADRKRR